MRRNPTLLVALSLFALSASCGAPESILLVEIDPQEVPGDGRSSAEVRVRAIFDGQPVKDGTRINVTCTGGSFEEGRETTTDTVNTTAGEARLTWYAPEIQGEYRIGASYTDPYSQQQQAQGTVLVVAPPPIQGSSFTFSCTAANVGVPRSGEPNVELPCNVTASDTDGNQVDFDLNRFGVLTETGQLIVEDGQLYYVISPRQEPVNVTAEGGPTDGEPRWVDATGVERNPRDGIAALVVHTEGMPTGPADALQGEPYIDANDDGIYTVGETFFDHDENGSYTPPGGAGGPTRIWRWVKLVLSGPVNAEAPVAAGLDLWTTPDGSAVVDVPHAESRNFSVILVDQNLNPVASHSVGSTQDTIELRSSNSRAELSPARVQLARDSAGVSINATTGALDCRAVRTCYTQGLQNHVFTVTNGLSTTATAAESWQVEGITIKRTPAPGARQVTENLPLTGAPGGQLLPP